jgi:hypothetical protein
VINAATSEERRRRRLTGEVMTDWFIHPVNHLYVSLKRM